MPVMNVTFRAGDLDSAAKADLAGRLSDVLIRMEGGADTRGGRAFAWVLFSELPPGDWWVGGAAEDSFVSPPGRFLVHVTIPEGYMNQAQKSEVHGWVNDAILAATGTTSKAGAGASILVVIDEVPEGNWGCAGKTINMETISASVGLSKISQRYVWVESYFAAKARMLTAFDYPRDMGGVLPSMSRGKRQPQPRLSPKPFKLQPPDRKAGRRQQRAVGMVEPPGHAPHVTGLRHAARHFNRRFVKEGNSAIGVCRVECCRQRLEQIAEMPLPSQAVFLLLGGRHVLDDVHAAAEPPDARCAVVRDVMPPAIAPASISITF